ncbi:VanZ family protein [uncultured Psychroserpens sp.]|uniref:VanZ family protein n=1 Tax=uncultured Psychroserpens sp. TaxID=255436 RepID=UPI00262FD14E|nr:VanZ family protein [uncultured Psychroserpens sp.]
MITKLLLALKKWALPVVILYALALTIGSLATIGDFPSLGSSFDDKIYHFLAYFVFALLVFNYCNTKQMRNAIVISAIVVILYGIIIEVLQNLITSYRTLDVYDALANSLGVLFATVVLKFRNKLKLK